MSFFIYVLLKKVDKIEVNIKNCHIICSISYNFNPKNYNTNKLF